MIKPKMKKCRGSVKETKGLGCGAWTKNRILGLCWDNNRCYQNFLYNTEEGRKKLEKSKIKAKKKVKSDIVKAHKDKDKEIKMSLLTADGYRSKYLQRNINKIARFIDYGNGCIATNTKGKMNGGHYYSVQSNRTICLNLHNIFIQSFHSNHFKSGDAIKYQSGLKRTFGNKYYDFVASLKKCPVIKLSKDEMIEANSKARIFIKEHLNNNYVRSAKERIELRNKANDFIGIYPKEFSEYVW